MIVVRTHWGLANRLFFFAYVMALGRATGHSVVSLALTEAADYFEGAQGGTFCRWPNSSSSRRRWPAWWHDQAVKWALRYHTNAKKIPFLRGTVIEIGPENNRQRRLDSPDFLATLRRYPAVYLSGWIGIENILLPQAQEVRIFFTPRPEIRMQIQQHLTPIRSQGDILVGIHIRWGDFISHEGGRYYYSLEVYRSMMQRMTDLFPGKRLVFLVCSNEKQAISAFAPFTVFMGPGSEIGDLYSLATCDYIISPNSTYSLWAAFYGQKPYCCMKQPDYLPALQDFVIPNTSFEGLHHES